MVNRSPTPPTAVVRNRARLQDVSTKPNSALYLCGVPQREAWPLDGPRFSNLSKAELKAQYEASPRTKAPSGYRDTKFPWLLVHCKTAYETADARNIMR